MQFCRLSSLFAVGHGQSEGDRMNIKDFQVYIRDSLQHIDVMKARHPDLPVFIVGHSMVGHCPCSILLLSAKITHQSLFFCVCGFFFYFNIELQNIAERIVELSLSWRFVLFGVHEAHRESDSCMKLKGKSGSSTGMESTEIRVKRVSAALWHSKWKKWHTLCFQCEVVLCPKIAKHE